MGDFDSERVKKDIKEGHPLHISSIAIHQLNKAIDLFFEGDYVCCIGLAGSSEELIGKLIDKENSISYLLEYCKREYSIDLKNKAIIKNIFNGTKNKLKHFDQDDDPIIKDSLDGQALFLLCRAVANYFHLDINPTPQIKSFMEYLNTLSIEDEKL